MLLKLENINKKFGKKEVLKDISFEVHDKEIIAIVGPSGSGKSTLLRCINMIDPPTSGIIKYDKYNIMKKNIDINKYRMNVGMVFQQFNLFSHLTVIENITLVPIKLGLLTKEKAYKKGEKLLNDIGLLTKENEKPINLSGGEQQRVAIVRALMMEPKLLLFDEPTSSLDPQMTREVLELIKKIATTGMNMMIVSHELNFVKEVATRILFIKEGKIIFDGPKEEFFNNKDNQDIKDFLIKTK
ncbi:MAG: amino acid ABC transporter ATP-binding protein [Bacilli bacterium]|nr:amino acid ABC transporter ATP-binding protein [Bacilli bacterium]